MGPNFLTAVKLFSGSDTRYVGTGSNDTDIYTVTLEALGAGGGAAGRTAMLASDELFNKTGKRNIVVEGAAGGGGAYLYGTFEAPGSTFITISVEPPGTNGADLQALNAPFNLDAVPTSANDGTNGGDVTVTTADASVKIRVQGGKGAICKATSVSGGDIPFIERVPGAQNFTIKTRGKDAVFGTDYTLKTNNINPWPDATYPTPQTPPPFISPIFAGRGGWSGRGNTEDSFANDTAKWPAGNGYCWIRSVRK
jgi:hypothetical protein